MKEMRYLWNTDHALSGTRLKELLPDFRVTALDEVLRKSLPESIGPKAAPANQAAA